MFYLLWSTLSIIIILICSNYIPKLYNLQYLIYLLYHIPKILYILHILSYGYRNICTICNLWKTYGSAPILYKIHVFYVLTQPLKTPCKKKNPKPEGSFPIGEKCAMQHLRWKTSSFWISSEIYWEITGFEVFGNISFTRIYSSPFYSI